MHFEVASFAGSTCFCRQRCNHTGNCSYIFLSPENPGLTDASNPQLNGCENRAIVSGCCSPIIPLIVLIKCHCKTMYPWLNCEPIKCGKLKLFKVSTIYLECFPRSQMHVAFSILTDIMPTNIPLLSRQVYKSQINVFLLHLNVCYLDFSILICAASIRW